jgi:hypothetical protein
MSFKVKEEKELKISPVKFIKALGFYETISQIVQPYSKFFAVNKRKDIYSGDETIPFSQRHPTFKALMKLEFQDALRDFKRK